MNAQENQVSSAVATQAAPVASQLITLEPAKYATEVYQPFKTRLAQAIESIRNIDYDITTVKGLEVATKARRTLMDIRIDANKERKVRKDPIIQIGKLLESHYDDVEAMVLPVESFFDADIKAEEKRKDDIKAAEKAREEQARLRLIAIRELPLGAISKNSTDIAAMIVTLDADEPGEDFGILLDAAKTAHAESMAKLKTALDAAVAAEEEAARIAAERAELEQLRAAAAERKRVAEEDAARVAAAQKAEEDRLKALAAEQEAAALREREAAAARLKAEADAQAEKNRLAQAEIDRQLAEIAAAKAAQAAEAKVAADRQAAADAAERERQVVEQARADAEAKAEQAKMEASAEAKALAGRRVASGGGGQYWRKEEAVRQEEIAAAQPVMPVAVDDDPFSTQSTEIPTAPASNAPASEVPTLKLGQINERIAPLTINLDGMRSLGFEHSATDKSAKLFKESEFPAICATIIAHVAEAQAKHQVQ